MSDCTEVFANIYDIAFPTSKKTQCATHIQRKLWKGVGNGAYSKYVIDKPFLNDTARIDVNNLYHCITQKQFSKYAELVKEGWTDAQKKGLINSRLVPVFFGSYITNNRYNQWSVNCSGVHGYDPTNQATERSMETIKGTATCEGYMKIGYGVGTMIKTELPKMIYKLSMLHVGVESKTCLL